MRLYLNLATFRAYILDWILVGVLWTAFFTVCERAQPFSRQFELDNPKISHPFAHVERFSDNQLYLLTCILPAALITVVLLARGKTNYQRLHLAQVSNLGFWVTMGVVGVVTDSLKVWIANPRPDFLERCGPNTTQTSGLADILVCTAPLGRGYLIDGLKLTPLGHSSFAFAGLGFLSLWLMGQFQVWRRNLSLAGVLMTMLPILLASYIALSRGQDYRHHLFDIGFGSLIGMVGAWLGYHRYFPWTNSGTSNEPLEFGVDEKLLV